MPWPLPLGDDLKLFTEAVLPTNGQHAVVICALARGLLHLGLVPRAAVKSAERRSDGRSG